jgi:hypothetical protein
MITIRQELLNRLKALKPETQYDESYSDSDLLEEYEEAFREEITQMVESQYKTWDRDLVE